MTLIRKLLVIVLVLQLSPALSQEKTEKKKDKKNKQEVEGIEHFYTDAEYFFNNKGYSQALPLYLKLAELYPKVTEYKFKAGICYLHKADESEMAITVLEQVFEKSKKTENILFYLGRAYALNYEFGKAAEYYELALKSKKTSDENKKMITFFISQCDNAEKLVSEPVDVTINNLGPVINSEWSEYSPVLSSDQTVIVFTYRGEGSTGDRQNIFNEPDSMGYYYEDLYISHYENGSWSEPVSLSATLNTPAHEASVSLSADGQELFIYKDTPWSSGDIYSSKLEGDEWGLPDELPVNSEAWEGSACLSPDGQTLFFSSERDGGFGGIDIYMSRMQGDSAWSEPENMGSTINTPYDDDGAFMHADGVTFYYSSKGHNSMGGYDIFETRWVNGKDWTMPRNVGYPINTTHDDVFFVVAGSGEKAYYSSARKDGYGQQDIYILDVKGLLKAGIVALVKGTVTFNNKPLEAYITVRYKGRDEVLGEYGSNSSTGDYKINLNAGSSYVISYVVARAAEHTETLDLTNVTAYTEKIIDVNFGQLAEITMSGTLLISEDPRLAASNVKVILLRGDSLFLSETITDENGYFIFANLKKETAFILTLDADDENLKLDSILFAIGNVKLKGMPMAGLYITDAYTDEQGNFRARIKKAYRYTKLKPELVTMDVITPVDVGSGNDLLELIGDKTAPGLVYKVQVAAYVESQNFNYTNLTSIGKVNKETLDDGITRFTMGSFDTLREANDLKKKVVNAGIIDAFVLAIVNGKRTYLGDLPNMGIFNE